MASASALQKPVIKKILQRAMESAETSCEDREWCTNDQDMEVAPSLTVTYPPPTDYQFMFMGSPRKVDRYLEVLSIGTKKFDRVWPWSICTPRCLVQFREIPAKYAATPYASKYVNIVPDYFDRDNAWSAFGTFMNHIKEVSQHLKVMCENVGRDTSKWEEPEAKDDNMIIGIRARVKIPNVLETLKTHQSPVQCLLKLSCVYFNRDKACMSLEIIECMTAP